MKLKDTFDSPYEQCECYNGTPFTFVSAIDQPDKYHDACVLPMYVIEFPDGKCIEAWPEEILDEEATHN